MRIALDAMGGDAAPQAMVQGAIDYARQHAGHTVFLVGREDDLKSCVQAEGGIGLDNVQIRNATEVIGMGDKIAALKERPDDSMNVSAKLVKDGDADAMVLCGNTGCSVAAAQLHLRRIRGVKRAGILTPLPTLTGHTWVCDCGANAVGKPEHLAQFAEMAASFLRHYQGGIQPKIGILNIGSEDGKGNELTAETMGLLRDRDDLGEICYVEGNHINKGVVDVIVCDGFTGNIVLKTSEGVASAIGAILKEEAHKGILTKIGGLLMKPAVRRLKKRTAWTEVGGCLLLGVDGITVIGHGRSDRTAVANAIRMAARCVDSQIMKHLRADLAQRQPV